MERVQLGNSDIKVSPVCVGCWQFNNGVQSADKTWNPQPEQVSRDIVDKALEVGINFFDTAEGYLNSEEVVGRIFQGRRNNVVLASKFGGRIPVYTAVDMEQSITNSLQKLQTTYIDLYQVHWPVFVSDFKECFDELNRQKAKGRILEYGVSNFGQQNLHDAVEAGAKPVTNQLSYSLLWRPIEYEIVPTGAKYNIDTLAYSPLQQGLLTGRFNSPEDVPEGRRRGRLFNADSTSLSKHGGQGFEKQTFHAISEIRKICNEAGLDMSPTALSWCLQQPTVKSVIVGASTPDQVERNVKVAKLQQDVVNKLSEVTKELKEALGNTPDMWAKESRIA